MIEAKNSNLVCFPPNEALRLWPLVRPFIEQGYAAADEFMPVDIEKDVSTGRNLIWAALVGNIVVAALTTALLAKPSGLVCKLVSAGGSELEVWKGWYVEIEKYAKGEGCVKVLCEGRPGWGRVMEGYTQVRSVIEKKI